MSNNFFESARHQVREALAEAIADLSKAIYCSQWNSDIEFELWDIIVTENHRFRERLIEEERHFFRSLAEAAGGWVTWKEGEVEDLIDHEISHNGGVGFVPMDEWLKIFAEWKANDQ